MTDFPPHHADQTEGAMWCPTGEHAVEPDGDGNCPEHGTPVEGWD